MSVMVTKSFVPAIPSGAVFPSFEMLDEVLNAVSRTMPRRWDFFTFRIKCGGIESGAIEMIASTTYRSECIFESWVATGERWRQ
jgi:hypothetical protein